MNIKNICCIVAIIKFTHLIINLYVGFISLIICIKIHVCIKIRSLVITTYKCYNRYNAVRIGTFCSYYKVAIGIRMD